MRKTVSNLANVVGGEMLLRGANFAALIVMARLYGPEIVGLFAGVLAVTTVAVMLADNGLQTSAVTEFAAPDAETSTLLSKLLLAKTTLMVPAVIALFFFALFAGLHLPTLWLVSGLVAFRVVLQSYCQLFLAVLKASDRMSEIGSIQTTHFIFLVISIAATFYFSWSVYILLSFLVLGQCFELGLSAFAILRKGTRLRFVPLSECFSLLRRSTPVGFTQSLANIIVRLDVLILSLLAAPSEVGEFAAAHAVLVLAYVVSWLFGSVLLPEMTRLQATPERLVPYVMQWSRWIFVITAPVAIVAYWYAPVVLRTLYGDRFSSSGKIAAVLLLALPLILLNSLHVNHAIARGWVSLFLGAHVATVVLALALNVALGLSFAALGVAAAVVTREVFLFFVLTMGLRQSLRVT